MTSTGEDDDGKGVFIDDQELDETKQHVKSLMQLNDEIKEISDALAERRKQHKVLNGKIFGYMKTNQIPHFDLAEKGKLQLTTTSRKQPLSSKWIASQLKLIDGLEDNTQLAILKTLDDRPVKQSVRLQHKKTKA